MRGVGAERIAGVSVLVRAEELVGEGGVGRGEEEEALDGVIRVERAVGEAGSGKARGWWRVETIVTVCCDFKIDLGRKAKTRAATKREEMRKQF